jgi:hypothetical protein
MAKKTIYITEAQKKKIKKDCSAMAQVHNKVNSGIMAGITCGGMYEETMLSENSNDRMVNAYIKQLFGIDDFQEVRNKVMDAYKKVPMARAYGDKFLLGVLRYIYEEKIQPKEYPILNYMISQMPYSFCNSFDGNFNGIPYTELKEKLFPKYAETIEPKTDCPKVRQAKNGYIIRRIDSFTEMHYYDAGGNWCIGNQEDMWYELIQYETVYIVENPSLVKKVDAEQDKYEEKWDEAGEYDEPGTDFPRQFRDEYALSRFVVISSENGIFEVYSRYNIPNCHDGGFLSAKELEKLLGIPVREAFPYIPSEEKVEMENLNEGIYDIEDLTNDENLYDCTSILEEFLNDKKRGIKVKQWNLIPAEQYQNLLRRYMTSPEMARIPYEVVLRWFKDIIVPNAFAINNITMLAGHSSYFPFDDVYYVFGIDDGENDYNAASELLEKEGFYDWCKLPDGSDGWSDYGLEPLMKIVMEYRANMSAEDILILINRCLDVAHQRGDLASAFIQGGSAACSKISNSLNENPNKVAVPFGDGLYWDDGNAVTFLCVIGNKKIFVAKERGIGHTDMFQELYASGQLPEDILDNGFDDIFEFYDLQRSGRYWPSENIISLYKTPMDKAGANDLYDCVDELRSNGVAVDTKSLIVEYWDNPSTNSLFLPYSWFFNGTLEMLLATGLKTSTPLDKNKNIFAVRLNNGVFNLDRQGNVAEPATAQVALTESISSREYDFKKDLKSILQFMKKEGLNVYPYPKIKLNWEDQDGLFIKTGYYEPDTKTVVLFCKDRHPKDILRSAAHEFIHHSQNLDGQDLTFTAEDDVKDNGRLEEVESDAYLRGNICFRKWTEYQHGKEMLQESINENLIDEISPEEVDLSSFNIKKNLNPKFWKDGKLDSRIRLKLLDISDDFIDFLEVDWAKPKDVIITGSLANYNWSKKYSDIDLHVLYDFKDIDEKTEFVKEYFDAKKKLWNEEHPELTVFGFPIEVYVQDANEEHASTGVYSLDKNDWITEPKRKPLATAKVNKEYIKKKVAYYANLIDKIVEDFDANPEDEYIARNTNEKAEALFKRIRGERTNALGKGKGEISNGNVIFKALRRFGYIEKIIDVRQRSYDALNSINEGKTDKK